MDAGRDSQRPEHARVYADLRQRILDGELAPGDSLTLRGIADEHGVSMTPAREAVRRLVAERALAMTPAGRVLVPVHDQEAMEELFRARALLEPELAARAAGQMAPTVIETLRRLDDAVGRALDSGDVAGYVRANIAFHDAIYGQARAPALLALVHSVWLQSAPLMRRVYGLIGTAELDDFHAAAIDAAAAGDPGALSLAIREDVGQGARLLVRARLDALNL